MFLFLEIMLKEPGGVVLAELIGPGDQRTIAGDLVMFDSLSRTDDAGIEDNVVLDVRHMLFGLSQNPFDRIAFLATRGRVDELEHPLESFNLRLGLPPPLPVHKVEKAPPYPLVLSFGRTLTHFTRSTTRESAAGVGKTQQADADARQLANGDAIEIYNERGEFSAKACITNVPPGVVWIRDGWVGLNNLTSGDAVLSGDALSLFPFSVGQADYGARVEVAPGSIAISSMRTCVKVMPCCRR